MMLMVQLLEIILVPNQISLQMTVYITLAVLEVQICLEHLQM